MSELKSNKPLSELGESDVELNSKHECDHCEETFPTDELTPCAVEPEFHFCEDCVDKLRDF